jgi:GntR family transcriptional regulator
MCIGEPDKDSPIEELAARLKQRLVDRGLQPLWISIRDEIAGAISEGVVRPGMRMPSERLLAMELGVSRMTLRRAFDTLSKDGLVLRQQGARTVVARRLEKAVSRLVGFSEDMLARGRTPGAVLIASAVAPPTKAEMAALSLEGDASVVRIERVRLADLKPVAIERAVLPQAVLPDPSLVGESLYAALEALSMRPVRGTQRLRAVAARPRDARHLNCAPGAPLFSIERRCFAATDIPVEFTETRYLGEAYDFTMDLIT